jgi:hypothetical protein
MMTGNFTASNIIVVQRHQACIFVRYLFCHIADTSLLKVLQMYGDHLYGALCSSQTAHAWLLATTSTNEETLWQLTGTDLASLNS